MGKRTRLVLSSLGVILSIIGFYVSNAASYPSLQSLMSPSYASGRSGIQVLREKRALSPEDAGFAELAAIARDKVAEWNPEAPRDAIVVERLVAGGGGMAISKQGSRSVVGLKIHLQNQERPLNWDLLDLEEALEQGWDADSLSWASWLFWVGVLLTIGPLALEAFQSDTSLK